ncbi:hypothetical protein BY458DRAFT_532917 [Sporodiniella umbellata]|nr:hypothetical protein BY458DRAFT_532917 [Sporodiniella umbellata]
MYTLSALPQEILNTIVDFLEIKDLVSLARTNYWYKYWLSTALGKRIKEFEEKDGWRINIDILAKSHPLSKNMSPSQFSNSLLLLSKFCTVDPATLSIEFDLYPVDEEGLGPLKDAGVGDRSLAIFDKITTNINIVAYFAQISSGKSLKFINQAGSALINDVALWRKLAVEKSSQGVALMKSGFSLSYNLSNQENMQMSKVIEQYKSEYNRLKPTQTDLQGKIPATVCFEKVHVSPEFWAKQMEGPTVSEDPQDYFIHGFW